MNETETVSTLDAPTIIVRERLRLLALGHYIYGAMGLFMLPFLIPFFAMMIFMASIPDEQWGNPPAKPEPTAHVDDASVAATPSPSPRAASTNQPPPKWFFLMFFGMFGAIFLAIVTLSALTAYAGRCIQKRKRKTLVFVVAGCNCLFVPYGTLLGVSTILVLSSPEGQAEFNVT